MSYLALAIALVVTMAVAARATARILGVPGFRWFSLASAPSAKWRLALVWLAAAVAPWFVSASLFWVALWQQGEAVLTTRVEVLEGAARSAGMQDGDRILSIAGRRIDNWDQLKDTVLRQSGPTEIEVARGSEKLVLVVTPNAGRIGVAPITEHAAISPALAAQRAGILPLQVVQASVTSLGRVIAQTEHADLKGPVGIVRETGKAQEASALIYFLGVLGAYYWPFLALLAVFDAASFALFVSTHPTASTWSPRAQRFARLQQTIVLTLGGYVLGIVSLILTAAGVSFAVPGVLIGTALLMVAYPLVWIAGAEAWRRNSVWIVVLAGFLVPCVTPVALFKLLQTLRRELKNERFRVGFRSFPMDASGPS